MRSKLSILGLAIFAARGAEAHEPTLSRFDYGEHVRPLFVRHCGGCHREGGVGPMSLLDYQEAVPWANAIKLSVLESRMPPFLPGDDGGPFQGARTLTAQEIDTIVDWAVGTTPQGEPLVGEETAAVPRAEADLVLPLGDVVLEESESEKTACVVLPTGLAESRVVSSVEFLPRERSILRRTAIFVGSSCSETSPLVVWLPDRSRISLPDGLGWKLGASSRLALELRYVKGWGDEGKKMVDRSALGLWFSGEANPIRSVAVEKAGLVLPESTRLVALYATAAKDGPLRVESVTSDGSSQLLLSIERFDPAWSEKYFFASPVLLPAGARLRVSQPVVWADLAPFASSGQ
jgi:hypothetical protein